MKEFDIGRRAMVVSALAVAATAAGLPGMAAAQSTSTKPLQMVVTFPPGGPADIVGRLIAERLTSTEGLRVVVDNQAGANGTIGARSVSRATPDGNTILLTSLGAMAISPHLQKDLPFDPLTDFTPVTQLVSQPPIYAVRADSPVSDMKGLIEMARQQPGKVSVGTTGTGSTVHISMEILKAKNGVDMTHVPYRGAAPALNDILGNQLTVVVADTPVLMPYIQAGKLKALAIAAPTRSPLLPDVPTLAETGTPGAEAVNWLGLMAPANTPPELVGRLRDQVAEVLQTPEVQARLASLGAEAAPSASPEAFGDFVRAEHDRWGQRIAEHGIHID